MMYEKQDAPFTHHVFSRDEGTRRALKLYLKTISGAVVLISLTIWSILGIYWGTLIILSPMDVCANCRGYSVQVQIGEYTKEYII